MNNAICSCVIWLRVALFVLVYDFGGTMKPKRMVVRTEYVVQGNLWQSFPIINIDRVKDIPRDYPGPMAVPITIMDVLDRDQFDIVGLTGGHQALENGRVPYRRVVIRSLHPDLPEEVDIAALFEQSGIPLEVEFLEAGEALPEGAFWVRKMEEFRGRNARGGVPREH